MARAELASGSAGDAVAGGGVSSGAIGTGFKCTHVFLKTPERVDAQGPGKRWIGATQPKSSTRKRVESMVEPGVQSPLEATITVSLLLSGATGSTSG
jgi:hypothetical protein